VIGDRWAYAVDGRGLVVDYHDANDLPTALAPIWGFCAADDPGWHGTMAFAFSVANPGFVDGPDGGLGSRHTPGAWPLGHIQAWLVGRAMGDEAATRAAIGRLQRAAFADGMLPEARAIDDGESIAIRHWFAWPGAAFGAFWRLDRRGAWDAIRVFEDGGVGRQ
jgi:meiotically up-regulated gene 157 (Mug157) protein